MEKLFNKKKGMMVLVYIIMGLVVIGVMIPVISYIKKTSDTQIIKDYNINPDDGFVPWDYQEQISVEERIAKQSMELLVKAINALAQRRGDIKSGNNPLENNKKIYVYYYSKFETNEFGKNFHHQAVCKQEIDRYGTQSVNCKDNFDNTLSELSNKKPHDIDTVYSFRVDTGDKVCGIGEFSGLDLKTWDGSPDKTCSDSPSYVICGGYKIYYCGKTAWSIKTFVEKTSQPDFNSLDKRDGITDVIRDTTSLTFNMVSSVFGASPDQVSQAYCYDGVFVNITNKTQMCLSCDVNLGLGKCSFEGFELPQKITDLEAESWISGYGDPKYVMYYEQFPQGEEESWQISEVTVLSTALTVGSIAFDFIPLVGRVLKNKMLLSNVLKPITSLFKKAKAGVYDNTIRPIVKKIKDGTKALFGKSTDEIVEIALRQAVIDSQINAAKAINKIIAKESIESSLVSAGITSSDEIATLSDDIINNLGNYFDSAGNPLKEFDDFADDVLTEFKNRILENPLKYFPDGITSSQIDDIAIKLKIQVDEAINKVDYKKEIKLIALQKTFSNDEKFFMQSFKALFKEERGATGKLIYNLDESVFDDVARQVEKTLDSLSKEGQEKLFGEAKELAIKFSNTAGDDLELIKLFPIDENQEIKSQIINQIDSIITNAKYQSLFGKIQSGSEGVWNIKGRLLFGGVIAAHSAHMDGVNEKYTPAGINTISLSEVSVFEPRRTETLSTDAKDLFIRLDKGGRDFRFTNRFFMTSPCKTDLDIRREICSCAVESAIQKINGKWTGYILETDKGQVPVKNVDASKNDYTLKNFDFNTNRDITDITMGAYFENNVNVIDGQYVVGYPVLNSNVDITKAVKECKTRGWWDSNIFTFDNIDVKTECISITESNLAYSKYRGYNEGFNYCYTGENSEADALKGVILLAQLGISVAAGVPTAGVGLIVVSPIVNILGTVSEFYIDEGSKWPRRDYDGGTSGEYILATGGP